MRQLDRARTERKLSWRAVALQCDLTPSTLQRVLNGSIPDLPRFAVLIAWLGASADEFIVRDGTDVELHLTSGVDVRVTKRRASSLSDEQLRELEDVFNAIVRAIAR